MHDQSTKVARILVQYIVFMMYTGLIFDQIWCISTKLRICIRDVHILERIQKLIFRNSGIFALRTFTEHRHDNNENVACILVQYIVFMMYIGFIFDQIWHIKRLSIYIRNVLYSTENPVACPIRYVGILGRFTNYNTPDSVNFHDLSISVKYLTQDRMNVKICSKYV